MRKIKNPWIHKDGYDCFGCAPENPIGLKMEFFEEGEEILSFWSPQEHFQGWVGVVHGGIIATLVDEIAGWVVTRKLQTAGVTSKLEVKYRHSLMVDDTQFTLRAHIAWQKRRLVSIPVIIENGRGEVCVEAEAVYYVMDEIRAKEMGFSKCDVENEQLLPM